MFSDYNAYWLRSAQYGHYGEADEMDNMAFGICAVPGHPLTRGILSAVDSMEIGIRPAFVLDLSKI